MRDTKLAPLMPWMIRDDEPDMATGSFPVTRLAVGRGARIYLGHARRPGRGRRSVARQPESARRTCARARSRCSMRRISDSTEPVVAWQRYGKGQVLGIATNTMWKWAAAGSETQALFGRFWRQAVRGLTKKLEGGSLLGIHWNQDHYRPGEQAVVEVHLRASDDAGAIRLVGSLSGPGGDKDVNLSPVMGQADLYTAKIPLAQRGDYTFHLVRLFRREPGREL